MKKNGSLLEPVLMHAADVLLALVFVALCVGLSACAVDSGGDGGDGPPITPPDGEAVFEISATTDEDGEATVSFNILDGTTKFSVTAATENGESIRFKNLSREDGVNYLDPEGLEISLAGSFFDFINAASVPSRDVDPAVDGTQRYFATIEVNSGVGELPGNNVTFTINSKADPSLDSGRILVHLFYVGDIGQDPTTKEVVASALDIFRSIYASAARISLDIREIDIGGPVVLPLPIDGDSFYRTHSQSVSSPAINVFIGGDIEGLGGTGEVLGVASGIIGPPEPSERTAVSISIFAGAGPDGVYDSEDLRLLGETFAHEVAHFMGLFHPVDFTGSSVSATDPLEDTDSCSFITECVANESLTRNLMFPNPVPNGSGGYFPQNQLSGQQRGVVNRFIAVD